jgi:hypothetical protein
LNRLTLLPPLRRAVRRRLQVADVKERDDGGGRIRGGMLLRGKERRMSAASRKKL